MINIPSAKRLKLILLTTSILAPQVALAQVTGATPDTATAHQSVSAAADVQAGDKAKTSASDRAHAASADSSAVGEIIVTGTNIRSKPDAVIVPVIALDAKALEKTGVATNVLDVLRKSIPGFEGRSNVGASNTTNSGQFTGGGSSIQLRNLPTLVLINGRRAAVSGAAAVDNGKAFVDVNQIPLSAIERIDVLTDGASAIYGSDAIGGVVNLILKTNFEGASIGARAGYADGNYYERSVQGVFGRNFGHTNITLMASLNHSSPLLQSDRAFTNPFYGLNSALPGTVAGGTAQLAGGLLSPSQKNPVGQAATATTLQQLIANGTYVATTPTALRNSFNSAPYESLLLEQDTKAIGLTFNSELIGDKKLEAFGDAEFSESKSNGRTSPVPITGLTVPGGSPYNPLKGDFTNVTFAYLPTIHTISNDAVSARLTTGLRGRLDGGWRWETGLVYSLSELKETQGGLPFSPNLSRAIAGGYDSAGNPVAGGGYSKVYSNFSTTSPLVLQPALDPFALAGGVNSASLANLFGAEVIKGKSTLASFDAMLSGSPFSLPAGSVEIAVGGSARQETLSGHADENGSVTDPSTGLPGPNSRTWLGGTYFDPFKAKREVYAGFGEGRVPLTSAKWGIPGFRAFDLILAGRFEHYSDAGDSFSPKIGFRWQPFDRQVTLRGSYAESFAAPSLYFEFRPTRVGPTSSTLLSTAFGSAFLGMPFNIANRANPNLAPTTSTSKYLGVTLRPDLIPRLVVNVDYVNVLLRDFPGGLPASTELNSVNNLGSASPEYQYVTVDYPNGDPRALRPFATPGSLKAFLTDPTTGSGNPLQAKRLYLADPVRNLGAVVSDSLTISGDYTVPTQTLGTFTLSTVASILLRYDFTAIPGTAPVKLAGHSTASLQFAGSLPRYNVRSSLDWAYHDAEFTLGNSYLSATTDTGAAGTLAPIPVKSYLTWDLRAAYTFRRGDRSKLRVSVGVNNITNQMPPLSAQAYPSTRADTSTYSPIGRLVYGAINVDF